MKVGMLIKRGFDIIASAALLLLFSPVFFLVSILIWIALGRPIFFQQKRLGYQEEPFTLYKFRTMNDTRDTAGNLLPDNDRLTKIGKLLRSTTLDELPELINVLRGDMSVVGPRPLLVEYQDLYTSEQNRRHEMPPGMTGPVLVGGRNTLNWEEKFQQDIWYIDNWSLGLDINILARTIVSVLKREGINADEHVTMPKFTGSDNIQEGN